MPVHKLDGVYYETSDKHRLREGVRKAYPKDVIVKRPDIPKRRPTRAIPKRSTRDMKRPKPESDSESSGESLGSEDSETEESYSSEDSDDRDFIDDSFTADTYHPSSD